MIIIKEYAIYPFKNVKISQNYNEGNHLSHWKGSQNHSDKPWDEAGIDSGREFFIPQNDYLVEEILGLGSSITNTVRLRSVNKLYIPYKEESDYLYLTLTHMNEDNLNEITVGQILKKGTMILLEGTDGFATGNHFHITANLGKYYGLLKNSNGSWCYTYDKSLIPEEAFYVDSNFNNIIDSRGSVFKEIPFNVIGSPVLRRENTNQLNVLVNNLRCRDLPSLNGNILGYVVPGIYDYIDYLKNDDYTWYNIGIGYIAYNEDWIDIYPKKDDIKFEKKSFLSLINNFFRNIFSFFKK